MLPFDHFVIEGKEIKPDTRNFLEKVLFSLLNNYLKERGITKEVEFLATNDIYVFRGTNIIVFSFSRSKYLLKPRFCEFPLTEIISIEKDISVDQPEYFEPKGWSDFFKNKLKCTFPVSICFPIAYLSLKDEALKEAHRKVAELLVQPIEEDIDRKKRIVRVNPIYIGRDFLIEPDLFCFNGVSKILH